MSSANYGTNLNNLQARAARPFIPSSEQVLRDRAYEAMAINARKIRERREHDCRRVVYAGDRT